MLRGIDGEVFDWEEIGGNLERTGENQEGWSVDECVGGRGEGISVVDGSN